MKTKITLIMILLLLISCNKTKGQAAKMPEGKIIAETKGTDKQENQQQENNIKIQFQNFTIVIDSLEAFDQNNGLKQIQKDTAIVYLEFGESIEGEKIKIAQSKFTKVKIYQRFENSITIFKEGPHCDLTEWKHYNSEWKIIKNDNNEFTAYKYTKKERKKGIKVSAEEFLEAVEKHCGAKWVQLLADKKNIGDYSVTSGISRIFLKIVLRQENGEKQIKIISFILPMGC